MAKRQDNPTLSLIAIGYARKSTERQARSVGDQRTDIGGWCKAQGATLAHIFIDEGISGSKLSRPGLDALLAYVEDPKNPKGVLVCWKRDRLVRPDDVREGILLEFRIERAGWRIVYLLGSQATGNVVVDTMSATVEHHANGEFLKGIASNALRGLSKAAADGSARWRGTVPYGYARAVRWRSGDTEQVIPRGVNQSTTSAESVRLVLGDPREVETVRYIYVEYVKGVPTAVIVRTLQERGIPAPRGSHWSNNSIVDIVRNPVYTGDFVWNRRSSGDYCKVVGGDVQKRESTDPTGRRFNDTSDWIIIQGAHDAIIERETFDKAQAIIRERASAKGGARRAHRFALSGILTCAHCGSRYGGLPRDVPRYQCKGVDPLRPCRSNTIQAPVIEGAVLRALREALEPYRSSPRLRAKLIQRYTAKHGSKSDLSTLDREATDLRRKIERGYANLLEVTPEQAKRLSAGIAEMEKRLSEVETKRQAAQPAEVDPEKLADDALELLSALETIEGAGPEARRAFFQRAVAGIALAHETRPGLTGGQRHIPTLATVAIKGAMGAVMAPDAPAGQMYLEPEAPWDYTRQLNIPADWLKPVRRKQFSPAAVRLAAAAMRQATKRQRSA